MRKSELLKQNGELYHQLDEALKLLKEYEKQLEKANRELEIEKNNNAQLKAKPEGLSNDILQQTPPEDAEDIQEQWQPGPIDYLPLQMPSNEAENEQPAPVYFNPESPRAPEGFGLLDKEEKNSEIILEEDMQYAADTIGKLVIESAKFSNTLTEGGNTAYIELVNLILGKTEVSKSEILTIAKQELPLEVKKQKIDAVKASTIEYFESVMAQR